MKILIIEDEKDIRENISVILSKQGYFPTVTDNVVDAESLIRQNKWDLIVSDVMIPHLGGFELVDVIKQVSKSTPILLVTGLDKDILDSTITGADMVLTKPFTAKALIEAAEQLLSPAL